jgi:hypothetical protein
MRIQSIAAAAVFAAGSFLSSNASADTVSATWLSADPYLSTNVKVVDFHGFSMNATGKVGVNNWLVTATTSDLFAVNQVFDAFCIELRQNVSNPSVFTVGSVDTAPDPDYPTTDAILGIGSPKANYLRELWGEFYDDIHVGTTAQQNINGAAFQLAVWNIVYDEDFTTSSGTFYATTQPAAQTQADDWLEYIRDNNGAMANLIALTNPQGQDMITAVHMPTPVAAGMGLSCLVLAMMRRRRARSA